MFEAHRRGALVLPFLLTACDGALVVPSGGCDDGGGSHPKHEEYSAHLAGYHEATRAPGVVLAIATEGEPAWVGAAGFADLTSGAPMCADTPFRIASITKTYTATAVMRLVEDGDLSLSDHLAGLLPEVAEHIPSSDRITVEHLLAHRSGLASPDTDDMFLQLDFVGRAEEIAGLSREARLRMYAYDRPLLFEPGTGYHYSNTGYVLLGMIAERVRGEPMQRIYEEMFFEPLGLSRSSLWTPDDPAIAHGHVSTGEGKLADVASLDRANAGNDNPAGGIVSTAEEVQVFFAALSRGELVSDETRTDMETPRWTSCDGDECDGGQGLGLYWDAHEEPATFGHAGALVGVRSHAFYFPEEQTTVVVLANRMHDVDDTTFARKIVR